MTHHVHVRGLGRGVGFESHFGPSKSYGQVSRRRDLEEIVDVKARKVRENWIQEEKESLL